MRNGLHGFCRTYGDRHAEEKPKKQIKLVETAKQVGEDAAREKAREEFKKLFPKAQKLDAPPSRRADK